MTSYKKIIDSVLLQMNQVENYALGQAMLEAAKGFRSTLIRRDAEKNGGSIQYQTTIISPVVEESLETFCDENGVTISSDYCVLKTLGRIPEPVRLKSGSPINFVGSVNGTQAFSYMPLEAIKYTGYESIGGDTKYYDLINGRIVLFCQKKIKFIRIKHPFVDVEDVVNYCNSMDNCSDWDDPIYMPSDMTDTIRKMLIEEFRFGNQSHEVMLQDKSQNQPSIEP